MKQIRDDFATHDFKAWLAQLIQRVEQMHLSTSYAMERIATWLHTHKPQGKLSIGRNETCDGRAKPKNSAELTVVGATAAALVS
jgi:hypothetical protein